MCRRRSDGAKKREKSASWPPGKRAITIESGKVRMTNRRRKRGRRLHEIGIRPPHDGDDDDAQKPHHVPCRFLSRKFLRFSSSVSGFFVPFAVFGGG